MKKVDSKVLVGCDLIDKSQEPEKGMAFWHYRNPDSDQDYIVLVTDIPSECWHEDVMEVDKSEVGEYI